MYRVAFGQLDRLRLERVRFLGVKVQRGTTAVGQDDGNSQHDLIDLPGLRPTTRDCRSPLPALQRHATVHFDIITEDFRGVSRQVLKELVDVFTLNDQVLELFGGGGRRFQPLHGFNSKGALGHWTALENLRKPPVR